MFLVIDNYDSFTYNIVQYFREENQEVEIIRNDDDLSKIDFARFTGIVLSPGPSRPENSGITLEVIKRCDSIPILGICLGMQAMVHSFGGRIVSATRIMHGKVDEITHFGGELFKGIPSPFKAVRYHSLAADRTSFPSVFEVMAVASDGEIMAIRHTARFLWGVQFHPESYLTVHGRTIIRNFIGGVYDYWTKNNRQTC